MATRPTRSQARLFAQLIAELTPEVHRAFMASVTDLQANVDWRLLLVELGRMNIEGAISALHIDPAAWAEYSAAVTEAYAKAGASTAAQIRQAGIAGSGVRFNMANPRAADWIAENVAGRVVGFTQDSIAAARGVIEAGFARGQGPRNIAVDLAGRASGPSGARTGGILGLDIPRADRLQKVTEGMRTAEGVRSLVTEHLDGSLSVNYKVNPATAQRIVRAYRAGTEVPESERIISERQYSNALLKARADTVASTETANAVMSARMEEWQQLVESQGLDKSAIIKTWHHRRGFRDGRPMHIAMSGKSVRGLDTPFVFADRTRMQHAHDPAGGATHNANCGCDTTIVLDHTVGLE